MKIKVYCPCGAKFEFEVEPVNDRMPVAIGCPVCGADATELANQVIQQQLSAPQAGEAPAPTPPAAAPQPGGLRISRAAPAPVAAPPAESATASAAPRPAPARPTPAASRPRPQNLREGELSPLVRRLALGIVALVALAGAAWFWYVWFGRDPKVMYSLDFPKSNPVSGRAIYQPDVFYELIAPNRLVAIKNQHLTLMDVTQQIPIWSVPLPDGNGDYFTAPHVIATTNDIWVAWRDRLMRVDRQSGAQKDLALPDSIISVTPGDNMILVLSGNPAHETVTGFSLRDGSTQTEEVTAPPPVNTPAKAAVNNEVAKNSDASTFAARNTADMGGMVRIKKLSLQAGGNVPQDDMDLGRSAGETSPFFDTGPNAAWFQTRLLERRQITREAMKKAPEKSVLDNPNVNASQGLELAEEMANKSQREHTGGVDIIDVSRYQVTLHRLFAHDISDWTGEVVGPPKFVPLKTVDLIVAGTNLLVFDKNNKKLWDAKLTYPVSSRDDAGDARPPCLETGDALYFADKGMLTRFDPTTGNVRWRLTSVGISAVQADENGKVYLDTTTQGADAIQYSQQISLREHDLRVIMQVDPASGNILWRSDFPGSFYRCFLSGKFLYSARAWQTQDPLRLEEGPDSHFTFNLLQPSNGKMIWNHVLNNKLLVKAEVQNNWILLQFADQVTVLKFFSL